MIKTAIYLFIGGLILLIGPHFGFTLRGASSMSQSDSSILGFAFIGASVVFYLIGKKLSTRKVNNSNNTPNTQ